MSTTEVGRFKSPAVQRSLALPGQTGVLAAVRVVVAALASLRLTVVLLFLSLVLVFAGTLAQVDHDVWYVVQSYFRVWLARFELRIFFPRAWGIAEAIAFPFPGGKLLGTALAINLLSAHALRFKVAARGRRLWFGWGLIAVGAALTYAVIASGANITAGSELSPRFANALWHALRAALGGGALTLAYVLALTRLEARKSAAWWLWLLAAAVDGLLAALAVYLFLHPEARLDASGLRILWQLAKAGAATVVLACGCWAAFRKRAGIVLLHGGIGLVMFTELYTAQYAVEARMSIPEGGTAYYADDIREVELAFTDASRDAVDRTTIIPGSLLVSAARTGETISHPELPWDVRVTAILSQCPHAARAAG